MKICENEGEDSDHFNLVCAKMVLEQKAPSPMSCYQGSPWKLNTTQGKIWECRMTLAHLIAICDHCYSGKAQEAMQTSPGGQGRAP